MPSRIFQNVIIQMKDSIDRTVGVVDDQGYVIACSELAAIGSRLEDFRSRTGGIPVYGSPECGAVTVRFEDSSFTVIPYLAP